MAEATATKARERETGETTKDTKESTKESKANTNGKTVGDGKPEEPEEECGFCLFMKGGSCKTSFVAWEDCVDKAKESDGDFVEKCAKQTEALRDCMLADPGYYGDMLPDEDEEESNGSDSKKKESDQKAETDNTSSQTPVKQSRAAAALER